MKIKLNENKMLLVSETQPLRLLELRLTKAGLKLSAATTMQQMRALHSCLCWNVGARKAIRKLEEPSEAQAQIMKAMGYGVNSGVLQELPI